MEDYTKYNYGNSSDIAEGSEGILRVPIFSGSYLHAKYEGEEYYRVRIYSSGGYDERNHHTFRVEVLEVLEGNKKVGSKFGKRGKNLYPNYYEIKKASEEARNSKHIDRQINEINIDLKLV